MHEPSSSISVWIDFIMMMMMIIVMMMVVIMMMPLCWWYPCPIFYLHSYLLVLKLAVFANTCCTSWVTQNSLSISFLWRQIIQKKKMRGINKNVLNMIWYRLDNTYMCDILCRQLYWHCFSFLVHRCEKTFLRRRGGHQVIFNAIR